MTNQNTPFGNPQDRYAHPYAGPAYNYAPANPYGSSGRPTGPQPLSSGLRTMRLITLWLGVAIAISSIIFQISQMENSLLNISNFPAVAYLYMVMYFTQPYIMLAVAYSIVWLTSIRGSGYEKQKHTWLLVGAPLVVIGQILWSALSMAFLVMS